mgnify:CR=1 FL=1
MNSESEQRLSLQELKQRNTQQTALPTPTPPHEACPSKADWERMMKYMDALWCHADRQTDLLESVSRQMSQLPTRTQVDELLKVLKHLEQMAEQAGKPKEKRSSLPNIKLPRLHLPHLDGPTWVVLLMALAALFLLWWAWAGDWNNLSLLSL